MQGRERAAEIEALVERYRPLAVQLTTLVLARIPRSVDRGDLESAAMLGLFQAAQSWDDERGVGFEAFARHRIRGALLDELRNRDWASRRVRTFARRVAATTDELTTRHGRQPTDAEVADRMGVTIAALVRNGRDLHAAAVHSTDTLTDESGSLAAPSSEDPDVVLEQRERAGYLHEAVALLPDRLRRVIVGYYVEELPMHVLAIELGVSESRVSQMRSEGVRLLRGALAGVLEPERIDELTFGDHISARAVEMGNRLRSAGDPRALLGLALQP